MSPDAVLVESHSRLRSATTMDTKAKYPCVQISDRPRHAEADEVGLVVSI